MTATAVPTPAELPPTVLPSALLVAVPDDPAWTETGAVPAVGPLVFETAITRPPPAGAMYAVVFWVRLVKARAPAMPITPPGAFA